MKAYLGVTNIDWFHLLASQSDVHEANFWRPYGDREFRALDIGNVFLFKSKSPDNRIVGGGIFEGFLGLTIADAWDCFGIGNGAQSLEQFVSRIEQTTGQKAIDAWERRIGCILLRDLIWFSPSFPQPNDFSREIVQGKTYTLGEAPEEVEIAAQGVLVQSLGFGPGGWEAEQPATRGAPILTIPRLGQGGFRARTLEAYGGRCVITQHKIKPTLQAAHILPVAKGGAHRIDNGILLRSDVHTLFDRGYLTVDTERRLIVSRRLRTEFGNGEEFYSREGLTIGAPLRLEDSPNSEFLEWHRNHVFK